MCCGLAKKAAAVVLVADGFKGAIPVLIAHFLGLELFELTLVALAAFLGHVYPNLFLALKAAKVLRHL
jgi:acyl-phosphate glycerol-3-phosphate acyltransferase